MFWSVAVAAEPDRGDFREALVWAAAASYSPPNRGQTLAEVIARRSRKKPRLLLHFRPFLCK